MTTLREIFSNNRLTFYNYATNMSRPVWHYNAIKIGSAATLALTFFNIQQDFINTSAAIYSILIGFSFNILFYLSQSKNSTSTNSLEQKERVKDLDNISKGLFYNVLYFNFISIALLICLIAYYIPKSIDSSIIEIIIKPIHNNKNNISTVARLTINIIYSFATYLLIIESLFTFLRIIKRVNYYFEQKLKLQ